MYQGELDAAKATIERLEDTVIARNKYIQELSAGKDKTIAQLRDMLQQHEHGLRTLEAQLRQKDVELAGLRQMVRLCCVCVCACVERFLFSFVSSSPSSCTSPIPRFFSAQ